MLPISVDSEPMKEFGLGFWLSVNDGEIWAPPPDGLLALLGAVRTSEACGVSGDVGFCCGIGIIDGRADAGEGMRMAEICGGLGGAGNRIGGGSEALRSFGPLVPTEEANGCGCSAGADTPFGIAGAASEEEVAAADTEENRNSLRNRCI